MRYRTVLRQRHVMLWTVCAVAPGAVLAGCGGDDDDAADATLPGAVEETADELEDADEPEDAEDGDAGDGGGGGLPEFGDGTAVVEVGDETFEFVLANQTIGGRDELGFCRDVFDAIQAFGYTEADDGRIIELTMLIPPANWDTFDDGRYDPPSIEVAIEDAEGFNLNTYVADQTIESFEGMSQVDEYEIEGTRASGTATFLDEIPAIRGEGPGPVTGTFEVACAAA